MAVGWLTGLSLGVALAAGCVGNPNGNPVVEVAPVCAADSQDEQFFGSAFTRDNASGRAQLSDAFARLAEYSEPSLACSSDVDEAYRFTMASEWPPIPIIIRVQRAGGIATLTAIAPRHDPSSGNFVAERIERTVTVAEWARIVEGVAAVDVMNSRALPLPHRGGPESRMFLFEFRVRGSYSIIQRSQTNRGDSLFHLQLRLIDLAGCEYHWGDLHFVSTSLSLHEMLPPFALPRLRLDQAAGVGVVHGVREVEALRELAA